MAIGYGSRADTADAVAPGRGARVTAANAVAIGAGSVADEDDTLAVGDRRIDRQGAISSAMLNMAINAAGSRSRVAVGAGFQNVEQALSVGYGRRIGERGSFSVGGAFSGSERSAGIGAGFDL